MFRLTPDRLDPSEPWLKTEYESDDQYYWLEMYLQLGEQRSIELLAMKIGLVGPNHRSVLFQARNRFLWDERAYHYDQISLQLREIKAKHAALSSHEVRVALLTKLLSKLDMAIERLDDVLEANPPSLGALTDAIHKGITLLQTEFGADTQAQKQPRGGTTVQVVQQNGSSHSQQIPLDDHPEKTRRTLDILSTLDATLGARSAEPEDTSH
jgi:hypothetical protein